MSTNDAEAQRKILNRLRRASGQLTAVIAMVEGGGSCRDVVTQLSAVSKALDRAGFAIITSAMKDCLVDEGDDVESAGRNDESNRAELTTEELEKLFLMLA